MLQIGFYCGSYVCTQGQRSDAGLIALITGLAHS